MSLRRNNTTPQELSDPEDCMVNDAAEASANEVIHYDKDDDDLRAPVRVSSSVPQRQGTAQATTATEVAAPPPPGQVLQPPPPGHWVSSIPLGVRSLISGGVAGMVAKSVVAPIDRIKILYQVSSAEFHVWRIPTVMRNIVHNEGFQALWKGNTATMIRVFPYSGVQFMTFDRCKLFFLHEHERGRYVSFVSDHSKWGLTPVESLISGMVAGTVSVIVTYPLDLTRAQLAVLRRHNHDGLPTKGFVAVLTDNYKHRGFAGLFRGITPTLLGILPYSGIAFTLNEQGKKRVRDKQARVLYCL